MIRAWLRRLRAALVSEFVLDAPAEPSFAVITLEQVEHELAVLASAPGPQRDWDRVDYLLDMRTMLRPESGSAVPRSRVPVVPGRTS